MNENTKAVATRATDPNQSLAAMLDQASVELRRVAPKYVNIQRMIALVIEAKQRNPLLANCSPASVVNFCKRCAEAGTDRIGAGGMWAVPFYNTKTGTYEMTPIPDWRLLIEKAKKAKAIKHATAEAVYENDHFEYERGLEPKLVHRPALSNRGKLRAVYCIYVLPDDTKDFVVMDWEADVVPIRNRTNAWKSWIKDKQENPWVTAEAEQAKKTVVKRAMKLFEGASPELTKLIEVDNVVFGFGDMETASRVPIAEPKAIAMPSEIPPAQTLESEHIPPTSSVPPDQSGQMVVTGILEEVSIKSGEKNGKPWTKYGLRISGEWYGTFDAKIGEAAHELEGQNVRAEWAQDGKYKTVISVTAAANNETTSPATADDSAVGLIQRLMPYESGFPRLFKRGCEHIGIGVAEWKTAPAKALERLLDWLDVESLRE